MTTSWDDGHPLDFRVADLLSKYGLKGTFYIPCENGQKVMSGRQIGELAKSFEIGAHTVHHVDLTSVTDSIARVEISESKRRMEEASGEPCRIFCFPRGRFDRRHVAMLGEAGFWAARTVELLSLERPTQMNGVAMVPTTVQAYPHSTMSYWKNLAKRLAVTNLPLLFKIGAANDWAAVAISLLELARKRGGVFHLWGHSKEIDESGQWMNVERVFTAMRDLGRDANCVGNSELCYSVT